MENPHATSDHWLIATDILSRTVSELSQLVVQILDTAFLSHPLGAKGQRTMFILGSLETRSGLPITVNWTFSLGVKAGALRAKIGRKSAISLQCGHFDPKFQVERVAPINHFCTNS